MDRTTYVPRGSTALFDAIGNGINSLGERLAAMAEEDRPSAVVVCIITDGQENSSTEFTRNMIKTAIQKQESEFSWKFVFLAANMDATKEGDSFGISSASTYNFATSGTLGARGVKGSLGVAMNDLSVAMKSYSKGIDFDLNSLQSQDLKNGSN